MASAHLANIILGMTLAAPIGPVSIEIIKRGLSRGFFSALPVCLGAAVGDLLYLILAYFGIAPFLNQFAVRISILSVGTSILFILGIKTFLSGLKSDSSQLSENDHSQSRNGFILGILLAIINPMTIVWWLGIFGAVMGANPSQQQSFLTLFEHSSIIIGVLCWTIPLSICLHFFKDRVQAKHLRWITLLAGLSLIVFAFEFCFKIYETLQIQ